MANDKKFIVKNGLLTAENVVIGDTLDRSTGRLQVRHSSGSDAARFDGRVVFDHDTISQGAIEVTNDGGTNAIIAKFTGTGGDLRLTSIGTGDYFLAQSNQNNGIRFYDGNEGLQFWYSNANKFEISSAGADFKIDPTVNGETIWYAGNDGSGSGLDADLIDGLDSLQFLRSDEDDTMNGSLTITGNLTVSGNTTFVNTEQLLVADNIFTLNSDFTSGTPTENSGMEIRRGDQANSSLLWDESADYWKLISAGTDLGRIITTADEGSGNGFDADTVDGLEAEQFLRSDADDTATGFLTFEKDLTLGDGTAGINIIFDGLNQNRNIYSNNGEIGFLNAGLNYAAYSDASDNWIVGNDVRAKRFVDSDNTSYYLNPLGTSVLGTIDLEGSIRHNGDGDTYITFGAADQFDIYTNTTRRFTVTNSYAESFNDIRAPRFVDSNNTDYYADPHGTSVFNDLGIDDDLFHNGDTDTKIQFTTDKISLQTGGSERFAVDNNSADFAVNVYAPIYYDSNNNSYYGDFDSISQMNVIDIDSYIRHRGDVTTYFGFPSNDVFRVYTNNIQRFNVDNDSADFSVNVYGPRYYDSDNTAYYGDFASTSQMNRIDIDDYIRHRGDTDTYIGFDQADRFTAITGGTWRMRIDNDSADFNVNVYAPRYYDSNNNAFYADPASTSEFAKLHLSSSASFADGGDPDLSTRTINATTKVVTPRLVFLNDASGDDNYIEHSDTGTAYSVAGQNMGAWYSFIGDKLAADTSNSSGIVASGILSHYGQFNNQVRSAIYYDTAGTTDFLDLGQTGQNDVLRIRGRINVGGGTDINRWDDNTGQGGVTISPYQGHTATSNPSIGISGNNGGYSLFYLNRIDVGNNPFDNNNRYFHFYSDGVAKSKLSTDATGNLYWIMSSGTGFGVWDESANAIFNANEDGNVVIGDQSPQYTDGGDNTPLVGSNNAAKLHVNGSIYLNSNNDAIVFGRGTASFLKDEELAFGWGGGWYMTDGTYLRVRNNKAIYSTGDFYGGRFYAQASTGYYLDPDGTSVLNRIGIDDRIYHNGDTDTYIEFDGANVFRIVTGNGERLDVNNTRVLANNQMHSPIFYDSNNTAYYGDFNSTSNMSRIDIDDYIRHRGDTNTYIGFNANDTFSIYTNGVQRVQSNATQTKIRQQTFIYGPTDALVIQRNANASGVGIKFSDNNSGEGAFSQNGTIQFWHQDNSVTPGAGAAFYFQTTEPTSHFVFGSDSDGAGTTSTNYAALLPDVNNVGYLGRTDRRWQYLNVVTGNFSGDATAANMYAARYYDSNNNAYYGDFASTSIMNTVRVNRLQVDGSTYFIDSASGDYGSIRVEGQKNGWAGYAIYDDWVFMSNGANNAGIYNDTDNEWSLYATRNSWTRLYANGAHQISAENGYGFAPSSMRSPIFYDSNNTNYFLNPASGNTSQALKINGRIYRDGFQTSGDGNNNVLLQAQDYTHWIWQTASNWGIMWAGNNNPYRSHFSTSNPNELVFIGSGNLRASIDLDNGNAYFQGDVSASDFLIDGGNENISLSPAYGSGLADTVLFDGTQYWEKRVTQALRGSEDPATGTTSEFVKNNNGPFSSTYALRTSAYRTFDSDYIEVEPGEELYGEIAVRRISGSGGVVYMGIRRYDKDKRPIAGNSGITYFVVGGNNYTSTNWTTFRGHTTIPTSHTPYSGSDGGGCKYVRVIVLMNYSSGGALREYGPPILKRSSVHSRIRTDYEMYASRYYDSNNNSYYLDPASTSKLNTVDASNFRDRDNTAYFMNPASGGKLAGSWDWTNGSIENLNNLSFNDPGPQEGIRWKGGNEWKIYESPNDLSTNSGGNLQFTSGSGSGTMRMRIESDGDLHIGRYFYGQRFYDSNNNGFYVDPASTSIMNTITADRVNMKDRGDYITFYGNDSTDHSITSRQSNGGISDDLRFNSYHNFYFNADSNNNNGNESGIYLGQHGGGSGTITNTWVFQARNDGVTQASGSLRAPIFYDSNDTGYYLNPNGTSRLEKIRFEGSDEAIEMNGTNPYIRWMENGTDRFYIQWREAYDAPLFRNQQGDHFDFMPDSSTGAVSLRLKGSDDDIWGYVYAADDQDIGFLDDQGNWAIRHNRDSWTYFYINNSLRAYVDNGSFQHVSSIRSPIFYDRNDTNYYGDFASTSRLNELRTNRIYPVYDNNTGIYIDYPTGNYGSIQVNGGGKGSWEGYSINGRYVFMSADNNQVGIYNDIDNEWMLYASRNSHLYLYYNGTWEARTDSGYFRAERQMRAPIYYDLNDTAWYANPNSTSRLRRLTMGEVINGPGITGYSGYLVRDDNRTIEPNDIPSGRLRFGFTSWANNNTAPYADYLHLRSYTDSSGGSDNLIMFKKSGYGIRYWQQSFNSGDVYSSYRQVPIYGVNPDGGGNNMFAAIYYDEDNTGYYTNPASTSQHYRQDINNQLRMESGAPIYFYTSSGNLRGYIRATESNDSHFEFATSGNEDIIFRDGGFGGSWNQIIRGNGHVLVAGRLDSPIFYDRNNTGYYVDPAGFSNLNSGVRATEFYARNWFRNDNSGEGLYNQATAMHWYSDSSSRFRLYSTSSTSQILFTTSGNNARGYVYANNSNQIGFLDQNGNWNLRTTSGQVYSFRNFYAPIMYDTNDTSYYVNPNGTSRMRRIQLTEELQLYSTDLIVNTIKFRNRSGGTNSDPMMLRFVERSGNQSHLEFQLNDDADEDLRIYGYSCAGYGCGEISGNLYHWFRSNGQAYHRTNLFVDGDVRTPLMYDSNNTGFYVNPAGTSRFNNAVFTGNRIGFINTSFDAEIRVSDDNPDGTGADFVLWGDQSQYNARLITEVLHATRHMRAPRYYDSNDGNYYLDPNSTSYLNDVRANILYDRNNTTYRFNGASRYDTNFDGLNNRAKATIGLTGQTRSSAQDYGHRPRWTGDGNYWTGVYGWGRVDLNSVANWGSGFFDTWSNPGNQPSGTSHWVGVQAYHYTNGGSRYGWQMAGGPIGNLRFRNTWGGFSGWRTIPILGVNSSNSSSMYASIYYDSNNTGYYCDPSNFSNFNSGVRANEFYARNWFRNDNSGEGLYNQQTGQHWYSDNDDYWNVAGGGGANGIRFRDQYGGTVRGYVYADSGNNIGFLQSGGSWRLRIVGGDYMLYYGSSIRAPLYYDSNNTFYYVNPASTSRMNAIDAYGKVYFRARQNDSAGSSSYIGSGQVDDYLRNVTAEYFSGNDAPITLYFRSGPNAPSDFGYITFDPDYNNSGEQAAMVIGTENDGQGSSDFIQLQGRVRINSDLYSSDNTEMMRWQYRGSTYGILNTDYLYHSSDMRSPIFYDNNNTGYYGNFASTSRMNVIVANEYQLNNGWDIYDDDSDTLSIRSNNSDHGEIRFRDSNTYCGRIYWDDDGSIMSMYHDNGEAILYADQDYITYIYYNGTWEGRTRSGYFEARGSFRAPIFYDQNNTFYYTNPASTSRMNSIQAYGSIQCRNDVSAYVNFSDETLKKNIEVIGNAVEKVQQIRGVTFEYKEKPGEIYTGVIAQEVEKVIPGIVYDIDQPGGETVKGVRYGNLAGLLVEATKEQQETINRQQEQLDQQQKTIDKLEEMVKILMEQLKDK